MSAKPSLDLLRALTEEHVLRALMDRRRLTRSEIASHTGISKPTISEAVRRLVDGGLVVDTGERSTGRGRAGSYYALAPECGGALVMSIGPGAVVAEMIDPYGVTAARTSEPLELGAPADEAARTLRSAARRACSAGGLAVRTAVVAVADPVDRVTGRAVHLPDAPFLVGDLDPVATLEGLVGGETLVDNDVNWAARAEHASGALGGSGNFLYLHLGEGLGCAVVSDGEVRRGHAGLAGEVAHLVTWGPDGRAMHLTEVFAALGLRRDGSTAIDVDALTARLGTGEGSDVLGPVCRAIAGAVIAAVGLSDPEMVVVGGTWGRDERVVQSLGAELARLPRQVPVVRTTLGLDPELDGARAAGLDGLRDAIVGDLRRRADRVS